MKDQMETGQLFTFANFTSLSPDGIEMVWRWRNHDAIRKWMYNPDIIPFENHLTFIEKLQTDTSKHYFLVKRSAIPIGVISISMIEEHGVDLGFYLGPEYHHKRLSVEFYYHVLEYVFEVLRFRKVIGCVLVENSATNSLNMLFGFISQKVERTVDGKKAEYYFSELSAETWFEVVKRKKTILQRMGQNSENE
jgi:UDP-4-amino-4,6-dideoxy-N-acetyl-beta-L-altrosamine N-acetyltransferase